GHAGDGQWAWFDGELEDGALKSAEVLPQPRREHTTELRERAERRGARAVDVGARRRVEANEDSGGFFFVERERRQRSGRPQRVAARVPSRGVDAVPEIPQSFDVAPKGPRRHRNAFGELRARPGGARLEQREEAKEAAGRLEHEIEPRTY